MESLLNQIPIPRKGIYWGVLNQEPPTGPFLLSINNEEIGCFQDESQALISIWFMGFSYKQLLILFPKYKSIQNIKNYIFPSHIDNIIKLKLINPRQLVDCEYIQIVKLVGFPNSKLSPLIYDQYYKYISGEKIKPDWIENQSMKMLNKKIEEYKSKIHNLEIELKVYEDLNETFK